MLNFGNNIFLNLQVGDRDWYENNTVNYAKVYNFHIQNYKCQEQSLPITEYKVMQLRLLVDKRRYESEQRTIIQAGPYPHFTLV
jgi:hypothetical protein